MHEQRERLVEEIRTAERARDLLAGLERRLRSLSTALSKGDRCSGSMPWPNDPPAWTFPAR